MQYADNQYKFVAVLNSKIELPKLLNAFGHITAGLISLLPPEQCQFLQYTDADTGLHPAISHYPFIVLKADNSNQIRTLRKQAMDIGIAYNDFTDTMLGYSAENQLQQTASTPEANLTYFGVVLFGASSELSSLTKKFSLWK